MIEQNNSRQEPLIEETLKTLEANGAFEITSYEGVLDLDDTRRFKKLELGTAQKMQIGALIQHMPTVMAVSAMSQAYVVRFPLGLPHTLMVLGQGGYGSMIQENGKIVGTASFYALSSQAVIMGAFSVMSIASSQFYLAHINNELTLMNRKLEDILGFLYGDKKAELLSEISFVRSAFQNYNSIMSHRDQRVATIIGLQSARKVAVKDIEFYLEDLAKTISSSTKDGKKISEEDKVAEVFKLWESLNLSTQLYVTSNIMEVHFSQNQDAEYLAFLRKDMLTYVDKCDKSILHYLGDLKGQLVNCINGKLGKKEKFQSLMSKIEKSIEPLNSGEESPMKKIINDSLSSPESTEFYIGQGGDVYTKNLS